MAAWVVERAIEVLSILPERRAHELRETLELGPTRLERWRDMTRKMSVPFHDGEIISQFEGYEDLKELDWDAYRARYGDIQRLDRILEAEGKSPNDYKLSKQADVLMLFYLLSVGEVQELLSRLGYTLSDQAVTRTIEYYEERSSHGSTLNAIVHAWAMVQTHPELAIEFYENALISDVADVQGGTTREGIDLAAMSGSVDLLQRCFAGLETRAGRLLLDPTWPESLGTLTFSIVYRDLPLTIRVSSDVVQVTAASGMRRPIEVGCRGRVQQLDAGSSVQFALT